MVVIAIRDTLSGDRCFGNTLAIWGSILSILVRMVVMEEAVCCVETPFCTAFLAVVVSVLILSPLFFEWLAKPQFKPH